MPRYIQGSFYQFFQWFILKTNQVRRREPWISYTISSVFDETNTSIFHGGIGNCSSASTCMGWRSEAQFQSRWFLLGLRTYTCCSSRSQRQDALWAQQNIFFYKQGCGFSRLLLYKLWKFRRTYCKSLSRLVENSIRFLFNFVFSHDRRYNRYWGFRLWMATYWSCDDAWKLCEIISTLWYWT